ncbi:tripartite motif-containing protein 16-like isoform X2 [Triplophysa dalaica]|uniref:tripartite motif-containing protein 16-like isoform X2 n=1 Tax=Triplophysa dalaica TaxID=1582913 RepID=UPI0024E028DB|nr:tripartite motif-containing protein 16-like isoform X2 [Triplophysa dalaica]
MAESSFSQDQFSCLLCQDILKDPVTFPCGHSYCKSCITHCWNDETKGFICSSCTFTSRPALDVDCDVCPGRKDKAVKSCMECLKSFCQNHLKQHESIFKTNKHNLMDPNGRLNEMICPKHKKPLEIFCRTDQQCICYPCTVEGHKNHEFVTVQAERTEKQRHLGGTQRNFQQRIQEREKDLQELREAVESYKCSAQTAVKSFERTSTELIQLIKKTRSEVTQLIREQERAVMSRADRFLKELEQEIDDLRKRNAELEKLSYTKDLISFLQSFQSVSEAPESTVSHNITVSPLLSFGDVIKSLSQLKEKLENSCKEEIEKISDKVAYITFIRTNKPKARSEFLQYYSAFTLDSNTVNPYLRLSDENSVAIDADTYQQYPPHPERFEYCAQVLCKESVSGRCYWEVEWTGNAGVYISMAYKTISRKSDEEESLFGHNNQSWGVYCRPSSSYPPSSIHQLSILDSNKRAASVNTGVNCGIQALVRQPPLIFGQSMALAKSRRTEIPVSSNCPRIGVYVDHGAGTLSFYSVSDTMSLIHRVQTTFTQPLYPGFTVYKGSAVKLCHLTKLVI